MNDYPCLNCSDTCSLDCELVYICFGGEREADCHACPRYEACCQEAINRAENSQDDFEKDRRLFE